MGEPGLHRRRVEAAAVAAIGPAGLGLPPVVDHGAAQDAAGPRVGVGIGALARQEERAQRREVAAGEQLGLGILLADGPDRGGRGEQRRHAVLLDHAPERARVGRPDGLALVEDGRAPVSSGA